MKEFLKYQTISNTNMSFPEHQTPENCLEAVKKYGLNLQFVKEQTPEICLVAVEQNGKALYYVKEQTPEICLAAVRKLGWTLKRVEKRFRTLELEIESLNTEITKPSESFDIRMYEHLFARKNFL